MYMQRILFILALAVALFFTADKAYAQRDLPGQVESTVSFRGRVAVSVTTSPRWPLHVPTVTVPTGCTAWIIR